MARARRWKDVAHGVCGKLTAAVGALPDNELRLLMTLKKRDLQRVWWVTHDAASLLEDLAMNEVRGRRQERRRARKAAGG